MKKILSSLLALAFIFVFVAHVHAAIFQIGLVAGVVTGPDGNPLSGASVGVDCNSHHLSTSSSSSGTYSVQFDNGFCTLGQTVTVTATKGSLTGSNSGPMQNGGDVGQVHLDVAIVNVPTVPEFGLITGVITLIASGASYLFLKKK